MNRTHGTCALAEHGDMQQAGKGVNASARSVWARFTLASPLCEFKGFELCSARRLPKIYQRAVG